MQIYEQGLCPGCGQPLRDATDPELEDHWTTMELATRCFPCTALARRAEEYRDSKYPQALRFVVGLREKGAALLAARREAADHDDIPEE